MKRSTYLFPLMAMTALSLTLAACDDKAQEDAAQTTEESSMVAAPEATTEVSPSTMPAAEVPAGAVHATNATAYATAEGVRTGAIFVDLNNAGDAADTLTGAVSDKASIVEIHEGFVDEADGTMQMRKVTGVEIAAGQTVSLKPGGYHIMLIDLAAPLVEGDTFTVTLQFQNAAPLVVPVTVTAPGAAASSTDHSAHGTQDDGTSVAPATTTDVPVLEEAPVTDTPSMTPTEEVPADAPLTEAPISDEQPAQ